MTERAPLPERPLDALRRATFAHAAHVAEVAAGSVEPGAANSGTADTAPPSARAALKPKRKANRL